MEEKLSSNLNRKKLAAEAAAVAVGLVVLGAKYRSWSGNRRSREIESAITKGDSRQDAVILNEPEILIYRDAAALKVAAALCIAEDPLNVKQIRELTGLTRHNEINGRKLLQAKGLVGDIDRHLNEDGVTLYYASDLLHYAGSHHEEYPALAVFIDLQLEEIEGNVNGS